MTLRSTCWPASASLAALLGLIFVWPSATMAAVVQSAAPGATAAADPAAADPAVADPAVADPEASFLDELTVTATGSERSLADTPGQIDLVDLQEIEERGYTGLDDLVRYLPGVAVEGDPTRLGTNGFTIRGVGGNRVLTEIDGVPTAEQFDFGPFSVHQFALDVETLESVEVVRSAGSALYGSDALGGVVALTTRGPRSYLGGESVYLSTRAGFDGRSDEASLSATAAMGGERWQGSFFVTRRDGSELGNQGSIDTRDATRTQPNPIDREQSNAVAQLSFTPNEQSDWRTSFEWFDTDAETEILSNLDGATPFSPAVLSSRGFDTQERVRWTLSQVTSGFSSSSLTGRLFDTSSWRLFAQDTLTEQRTLEVRQPSGRSATRDGLLTFDQQTFGARAELRKALGTSTLLTYGASLQRDRFDQLRDRQELFTDTGAPVPTTLAFPTKYFPETEVDELGAFVQAEIDLWGGRLELVPGVRFDRYALDADEQDEIFLDGNPGALEPVDLTEEKVSPKLGAVLSLGESMSVFAQYARGFRAPPMSSVNNGFTNQGGGYRTLPNPDLEPETSDNVELGLRGVMARGSFSVTAYGNQYDDFIDLALLGFNPALFLVEFQPQNVEEVEIRGVEVAAEARIGNSFTLRGALSYSEGTDKITDEPLESITPPQLVLGLRYARPGKPWGGEFLATATDSKNDGELPSDSTQFRASSSEVFDLLGWYSITDDLQLQVSLWNLTDETYWTWSYARGLDQESTVLDRYTQPGRTLSAQMRYAF